MLQRSLPGNRKLMICLLTLALITLGTWSGGSVREAQAQKFGDFEYKLDGVSWAIITGYTGSSVVNIPAELDGYPVVSIGANAFKGMGLTSVTIPNGVKRIYSGAFSDNDLTSVEIPNSVTRIDDYAFYGNQLTNVTIPDSVTRIEDYAFRSNLLTNVTIPNSVTSIGDYSFSGNQLTNVTIPNGAIGDGAFEYNPITSVTLSEGVTSIGNRAFFLNRLAGVTIPKSVMNIGILAFYQGAFFENSLTRVIVKGVSTTVGDMAFLNRSGAMTIIAYDPSPAKTHASDEGYQFTNILSVMPGAPTNVTATAVNGTVTVGFDAPASDGEYPITEYKITSSPGGFTGISATASPVTVTGLTYGTAYTFTVVAANIVGDSAASAPSASVTPVAPPLASLSALSLSGITLDPSMSGSVYSYRASVPNMVSSTTVTATVQEAVYRSVTANVYNGGNTLVFGPIDLVSGQVSSPIPLNVGMNNIKIVVIAQDGSETTYTATVTRAAAPTPSVGGGGGWSIITSKDGKLTLPAGRAGEVSLNNEIEISIPANASKKQLELTIENVLNTHGLLSNREILASSVFEVLKNFTENFDKMVTITMMFDPSKLKSGQTVAIFYYDEVKKAWVKVDGGKISKNRISAEVEHFTKFALLVVDEQTGLPVLEPFSSTTFSDIAKHWAEASIKQAVISGIVKGYTDGTFKPNATVTRAEFAVMLMNALKPQEEAAKLITFTDSATIGTWAQKAIEQAVQSSVVKGYSDGSFRPNAEITRTEMAVMIANALVLKVEDNIVTDFVDDADIPSWAKGQVAALKNLSLITGKGTNKFAPDDKATRAEAVTILLKMVAQESKKD
ncbi:leucine-rich repeat protein [Cohnella sp. WQ 127256]|uniref:leucine-rich repeat protein n=1 Tax=Cohnella sp. WQ 127256 TaxID=2938790 RepID=UPI002117BF77|nr:leucine-rich repeat protein [Cohnella sp. WQ 127256]